MLFHRTTKSLFKRSDIELVLHEDYVRFGDAETPNKQTKYMRNDVLCFVVNYDDIDVCIDTGRWRAALFAVNMFKTEKDLDEFVAAINTYWPTTKVFNQLEYQDYASKQRRVDLGK